MKASTSIILILFFALIWSGIVIKQQSDSATKTEQHKDSIIDLKTDTINEYRFKALMFDSANAKTERAYLKLEQTMKSGNLKHGKQ